MREAPLFDISVIVPVYNAGEMIEKCLHAINHQQGIDRTKFEIIVVDDASTDTSAQTAGKLCDRLITLQKNSGAATARNTGAKAASGKIIVFVDSDVILELHSLSTFMAVLEKDDLVAAVVGCYSEKPAETNFFNVYHNAFTRYHHNLSSKEIDWFWGAISAMRKDVFLKSGGFDERYQGASGEDLALGRILFDQGYKIVYIPEAKGDHAHHFTFLRMMKNDYLKAVTGMKMKLANILPRRAPDFINFNSILSAFLLMLCPLLIIVNLAIPVPCLAGIVCLIFPGLIIINRKYYAYVNNISGLRFSFFVPFLHWLQMYVIIAGAIMGVLGYLLGRSAFGRPHWI
jgi:glycosyltransferase involved in cell wall biosynthesis